MTRMLRELMVCRSATGRDATPNRRTLPRSGSTASLHGRSSGRMSRAVRRPAGDRVQVAKRPTGFGRCITWRLAMPSIMPSERADCPVVHDPVLLCRLDPRRLDRPARPRRSIRSSAARELEDRAWKVRSGSTSTRSRGTGCCRPPRPIRRSWRCSPIATGPRIATCSPGRASSPAST